MIPNVKRLEPQSGEGLTFSNCGDRLRDRGSSSGGRLLGGRFLDGNLLNTSESIGP
jgi:hypothetical protein